MDGLKVLLGNKVLWLPKEELLSIEVLAFVIYFSIESIQALLRNKELKGKVPLADSLKTYLVQISGVFSLLFFIS